MKENWDILKHETSTSDKVTQFEKLLSDNLNAHLPQKVVKICSKDKPCITSDIKTLDRKVNRIYKKEGKSDRYKQL